VSKVRVGIIGCGAIAERLHVPDYSVCPHAELVAFCDLIEDKAQALADRFAPEAQVYTDFEIMLKKERLDAVSICLPNIFHGPASIAASRAGCHVFVEKPMATSSEEAQSMIDAAEKAGKLIMVNQSQRRFSTHRKAKEVLESGILGKILYVTAMFGHSGPEYWSPTGKWFFQRDKARFGAMADLGVHTADLIRYLSGMEITEISAFAECLEKPDADVEDNFSSCIRFENGAIGTLAASWTIKGTGANFTNFHCENGTLRIDNSQPERKLVANLVNPACEIVFDNPGPLNHYEGSWGVDVAGAFVRAVLGLEAPFCSGLEGKKSLDVILAAEESAMTGKRISLKH